MAHTLVLLGVALAAPRIRSRRRRHYARFRLAPYRTDQAAAEHVAAMLEGLHRRVSTRWPQRLWAWQPSVALELHWIVRARAPSEAVLAICCPPSLRASVESAVRAAYPSASLEAFWVSAADGDRRAATCQPRAVAFVCTS
jgi:type IV secretory pathway protease TraF